MTFVYYLTLTNYDIVLTLFEKNDNCQIVSNYSYAKNNVYGYVYNLTVDGRNMTACSASVIPDSFRTKYLTKYPNEKDPVLQNMPLLFCSSMNITNINTCMVAQHEPYAIMNDEPHFPRANWITIIITSHVLHDGMIIVSLIISLFLIHKKQPKYNTQIMPNRNIALYVGAQSFSLLFNFIFLGTNMTLWKPYITTNYPLMQLFVSLILYKIFILIISYVYTKYAKYENTGNVLITFIIQNMLVVNMLETMYMLVFIFGYDVDSSINVIVLSISVMTTIFSMGVLCTVERVKKTMQTEQDMEIPLVPLASMT